MTLVLIFCSKAVRKQTHVLRACQTFDAFDASCALLTTVQEVLPFASINWVTNSGGLECRIWMKNGKKVALLKFNVSQLDA